jgi:hypothetical protein
MRQLIIGCKCLVQNELTESERCSPLVALHHRAALGGDAPCRALLHNAAPSIIHRRQ